MKSILVTSLASLFVIIAHAETPAELRAKAIDLLNKGDDNAALATIQQLLKKETPSDRGLQAPPSEPPATGVVKIFDQLKAKGFRLQREPGPADDAKPAEFTFTRTYLSGGSTSYGADFFLGWRPMGQTNDSLLEFSTQGKLHTGNEAKDAWIFRISEDLITNPSEQVGIRTTFSVKDEASANFDFNRFAGEAMITTSWPLLAMGQYRPIAKRDPETGNISKDPADRPAFQFRWRPYIGGDFGTWTSAVPTGERKSSSRGYGRVTADVRLNWLSAALDLNDATLTFDETACVTDGAGNHSYFKAGLDLMFNDNVGFSLNYKVGEDAPIFADEHSLTGSLTVKF